LGLGKDFIDPLLQTSGYNFSFKNNAKYELNFKPWQFFTLLIRPTDGRFVKRAALSFFTRVMKRQRLIGFTENERVATSQVLATFIKYQVGLAVNERR